MMRASHLDVITFRRKLSSHSQLEKANSFFHFSTDSYILFLMEQEVNAGHTLLKYDPLASKRLIEVLFFWLFCIRLPCSCPLKN